MAGLVVIFDFDKTIIDCDSDNWVVEELGINHLFTQLLHTLPWNSIMDRMMTELHNRGKTIEDVEKCLKKVPLHPSIASAIESAHAFGCDLRVVSDANVFFIETILKHHGLLDCFSEINTNPSLVDEQGRLRILPYHDFNSSPHGCNICPSNMCKGLVMEKIRALVSADGKKQLVYVGDGAPDFCAGLKLEEGDVMMPRKDFPICDLISANPLLTKAKIHEWSDWEELGANLLSTVNNALIDESSNTRTDQLVPLDCKYQNTLISAIAHEALQKAVPVSPPH
ncbi:thiamine phosphate phosphatase-like protein [Rosa rugosa]|uniref:thiamine phosphate phosphatase-like protein n=1 Tax=Rosa rugosa TaxID=74645 RepID=UPI002B40569F|nr:thiamine phosphate phosphatase-like protein [Rosa rugosa]